MTSFTLEVTCTRVTVAHFRNAAHIYLGVNTCTFLPDLVQEIYGSNHGAES